MGSWVRFDHLDLYCRHKNRNTSHVAKMESLIDKMHDLLKTYRANESDDEHVVSKEKIKRWINQFSDSDRVFVLSELNHIFEKAYFARSRTASAFFVMICNEAKNFNYDKVEDFLDNSFFIDCQKEGKSQKIILAIIKKVLNAKGYDFNKVGCKSHKHFLYVDDVLCTGKTFFDNIFEWLNLENDSIKNIKKLADKKITLTALYLGLDVEAFDKKIGQLYFKFNTNFSALIRRRFVFLLDINIIKPVDLQDEFVLDYQQVITRQANEYADSNGFKPYKEEFYRDDKAFNEKSVFTSEANRVRLENIFLKKGIEILDKVNVSKNNVRSLGYSLPSTKNFGFGTLFFTWRNVPNNAPLVFWYRSAEFEPLFDNVR